MLTLYRILVISISTSIEFLKNRAYALQKIVFPVILVMALGVSSGLDAQTGGRKRERKNKKHGSLVLRQYKSRGHADEFAKGSSGRRGWFSRLFKKDRPAWQNRETGSARENYKENRFLFSRNRSKGRQENAVTQKKLRRDRASSRRHGNDTFKSKKHKRKK